MNHIDKYRGLIERLERAAAAHPWRYRLQLVGLALLGYAFLGSAVVVLLALSVGVVVLLVFTKAGFLLKGLIKVIWIPFVVAGAILKSMWVRLSAPTGRRVTAREAPALVAEVERLRREVGAPRIHEIVITDDFNAAAASQPRLGIFGWQRRYLILGLPLLLALDRDRLAAVIAHEFGHFRGGDSRFAGWIYRVRKTWWQLLDSLEQQGRAGMVRFFFNWYSPYFEAYSFVLARQNEYDADAAAAEVVGAGHAAQALITTATIGRHLDAAYWPAVYRRCVSEGAPPNDLYAHMARELGQVDQTAASAYLSAAAARVTDLHDTHPALSDRLRALGQSIEPPRPLTRNAAEELLGPLCATLIAEFSGQWRGHVEQEWRARFQKAEHGRARIEELRQARATRPLNVDEQFDLAALSEDYIEHFDARPAYTELLAQAPDHAGANFRLANLLIDSDIEAAVAFYERAMAADPDAVEPACRRLIAQFSGPEHAERQQHYIDRLQAHWAQAQAAQAERNHISEQDTFSPHGLDALTLAPFVQSLVAQPKIKQAWLARKQVTMRQDVPHFVLLVKFSGQASDAQLRRVAAIEGLPGTLLVVDAAASDKFNRALWRGAGEMSLLTPDQR